MVVYFHWFCVPFGIFLFFFFFSFSLALNVCRKCHLVHISHWHNAVQLASTLCINMSKVTHSLPSNGRKAFRRSTPAQYVCTHNTTEEDLRCWLRYFTIFPIGKQPSSTKHTFMEKKKTHKICGHAKEPRQHGMYNLMISPFASWFLQNIRAANICVIRVCIAISLVKSLKSCENVHSSAHYWRAIWVVAKWKLNE